MSDTRFNDIFFASLFVPRRRLDSISSIAGFFTSSMERRPCSISLSSIGLRPSRSASCCCVRPCLTRASRLALPARQRSPASELTWPSPLQNSQALTPVWHPRSPQDTAYDDFAPPHSGQTTLTMIRLLSFLPASAPAAG